MNHESFIGKSVTIKSTNEVGKIRGLSRRRSGTGAMSVRFIIDVPGQGIPYECMPHEVTINSEAPMMGMSY